MRHAFPMDLVLTPEPPPGVTVRTHLVTQIRTAILDGRLAPATPLPSTRVLAGSLGIARGTAVAVYEDLVSEGYAESLPGSGTFVTEELADLAGSVGPAASASHAGPAPAGRRSSPEVPAPRRSASPSGTAAPAVLDLTPGNPSTALSPGREWTAAWRTAIRAGLPSGLPPVAGTEELRAALAAHVRSARGVPCAPEDVVVTAGTTDGLGLVVHALHALRSGARQEFPRGDRDTAGGTDLLRIATEDPGHVPSRTTIERLGGTTVPVPVGPDGMDVEALATLDAAAVLLTPSHQYPFGGRLPVAARLAVLEWARTHDAVIVEDDYDSEFRHGARALPAIASLDSERRVVLVGSCSKTLSPWLRCGYLVVPDPRMREEILAARTDLGTPVSGLVQSALAEFLRTGGLRRHLTRVGREYAHRRRLVLDTLSALPATVRLDALEGGLHATLSWEGSRTSAEAAVALRRRDVLVASLERYYHRTTSDRRNGIVLGYGAPTDLDLRRGLRLVLEVCG